MIPRSTPRGTIGAYPPTYGSAASFTLEKLSVMPASHSAATVATTNVANACDAASHCWSFCCSLGVVGIAVLLATARPEAGPDVQGDSGEKDQGGVVHVEQGDQDDTTQEAQGEEYGMAHEHPHVSIPRRTTARTARTPRVRATARIWVPAPISRTPSADAGGLRTPATPTAHRTSPSQRRSAARPRAGTRAAIGGTRATPR